MIVNFIQPYLLYQRYPSNRGNWIHGIKHVGPVPSNIVVLFFHGNTRIAAYQYPKDLHNVTGGTYYVFEYPGFGCRYSQTCNKKTVIEAADRAFNQIIKDHPDSRVFLIGQSMGTGVACEIAARYSKNVSGLVLITPYTKMRDVFNCFVPLSGYVTWGHKYECDTHLQSYIVTGGRALIIGAKHDEIIPFNHSV